MSNESLNLMSDPYAGKNLFSKIKGNMLFNPYGINYMNCKSKIIN